MPVVLVDARDGRIVAELRSEDEAVGVLEGMARDDPSVPEYLHLVVLDTHQGSLFGVDRTVTVRTLLR